MVTRRWSWPGPAGKPVYNYRTEGRRFGNWAPASRGCGRCLIPLDAFYDSPIPARRMPSPSPRNAPSLPDGGEGEEAPSGCPLCRPTRERVEPATARRPGRSPPPGGLLGVDLGLMARGRLPRQRGTGGGVHHADLHPGPDIAPYHDRQIVLMPQGRWAGWLGVGPRGLVPAAQGSIAPMPAGTLVVTRTG